MRNVSGACSSSRQLWDLSPSLPVVSLPPRSPRPPAIASVNTCLSAYLHCQFSILSHPAKPYSMLKPLSRAPATTCCISQLTPFILLSLFTWPFHGTLTCCCTKQQTPSTASLAWEACNTAKLEGGTATRSCLVESRCPSWCAPSRPHSRDNQQLHRQTGECGHGATLCNISHGWHA